MSKYDEVYLDGLGGDEFLIYRFDREGGVLQLSMSPSDLEKLLREHNPLEADGRVSLRLPFNFNSVKIILNGVRKIESTPQDIGEYAFSTRTSLLQRAYR